jgi:hypothetical protein
MAGSGLGTGEQEASEARRYLIVDGRPRSIQQAEIGKLKSLLPKSEDGWRDVFAIMYMRFGVTYTIVAEMKLGERRISYDLVGQTGKTWSKKLVIKENGLDFLNQNITKLFSVSTGSRVLCELTPETASDSSTFFYIGGKMIELNQPCRGTWNGLGRSILSYLTTQLDTAQAEIHIQPQDKSALVSESILKYDFKKKDSVLINNVDFHVLFIQDLGNSFVDSGITDKFFNKVFGEKSEKQH